MVSVLVLMIMTLGLAHMVRGSAGSRWLATQYWRIFRWTVGLPFILAGYLFSYAGQKIRGGRSGQKQRGRRNR